MLTVLDVHRMTTYYIEFKDGDNFLYYVSPEQDLGFITPSNDINGIPFSTWLKANRVWKETENNITLIKFRHESTLDIKEFMWIKLKAQPLKERE